MKHLRTIAAVLLTLLPLPASAGIYGINPPHHVSIGLSASAGPDAVEAQLRAIGVPDRTVALIDYFGASWAQFATNVAGCPSACGDSTLTSYFQHGRIPVMRIKCGDHGTAPNVTLNNEAGPGGPGNSIAAGDFDSTGPNYTAAASSLHALNGTQYKVYLAFFWEFDNNISYTGNPPNGQSDNCFQFNGTTAGDVAQDQTDLCAAFAHLHTVFQNDTNVIIVENYDGKPGHVNSTYNLPGFYCSGSVTRIGADIYDKSGLGGPDTFAPGFTSHFQPFYNALSVEGLPIDVYESGEQNAYEAPGFTCHSVPCYTQCQFLNEMEADAQSGSF